MNQDVFEKQMDKLVSIFEKQNFKKSFKISLKLKNKVLKEEKADPLQLGWFRYYQFQSLYYLNDFQKALDLLNSQETKVFVISLNNTAWMHSVGTELAYKLKLPDQIVFHGQKCIEYRIKQKNIPDALLCAKNVCKMLKNLNQENLNNYFIDFINKNQ
jgi:hypothetical protein